MQDKNTHESQCHYPDCTDSPTRTCKKCHHTYCEQHIHRRWWGSYICEICIFLKGTGGKASRDTEMAEIAAGYAVRQNGPRIMP